MAAPAARPRATPPVRGGWPAPGRRCRPARQDRPLGRRPRRVLRSGRPGREPAAGRLQPDSRHRGRSRRAPGPLLLLSARVAHRQLQQEPVQLGLRQRIGALVLDRVLGGHHEERVGQYPGGPMTVTWRSSIASSKVAWVFGGVLLISSARRTLVKTGPLRKRNSPRSKMLWPVTSAGIRSGVNCTRANWRAREAETALARSVLATPGTPCRGPHRGRIAPGNGKVPSRNHRGREHREREQGRREDIRRRGASSPARMTLGRGSPAKRNAAPGAALRWVCATFTWASRYRRVVALPLPSPHRR